MWLPKKLREAGEQKPWILLGVAVGAAFGISSFLENVTKLKARLDDLVISGVVPHAAAHQVMSFRLFAALLGLAIAAIFFAMLYLIAESRRRKAIQSFDERKTKAYRTLQGMMRAAFRLRTQAFPAVPARARNKTFDRIHLFYEIDRDFNAQVTRTYWVRAVGQPLHFWQQSFRVVSLADPAEYFVDINFKVRDVSGLGEVVYLPTENDERMKSFSLYFLPRIEVGTPARQIEISYRWQGMCKALKELGEESFKASYDSVEDVGELLVEVYLEPGSGGILKGEVEGVSYTGARVRPAQHPRMTGWDGFRYEVRNAPAGQRVAHAVLAKWRRS